MSYYIGQIFEGMYPVEASDWCNETGNAIIEISKNPRVFKIIELPKPTPEEIEQRKKEQLMMSNMTKLDFVNALEPLGVNYYEHLVPLLNSNLEAKKQWDLCERVYRFNPLLDELAKGFGITPNQLDKIFGGQ